MIGPLTASAAAFVLWLASWMIAALWSAQTRIHLDAARSFVHGAPTVAGFALLFGAVNAGLKGTAGGWAQRLWQVPTPFSWLLTAAVVAGFAFAWWARIHLGRLWSGSVTVKADHRVVDTGPYRLVRHPIYTGIILSAFALAAQSGRPACVLGAALIALGFTIKARFEERLLSAQLGEAAYGAYRARTPMLIPFLR
jgi:protein-S-isoprenylcysteine O-methyltransferase Ste14